MTTCSSPKSAVFAGVSMFSLASCLACSDDDSPTRHVDIDAATTTSVADAAAPNVGTQETDTWPSTRSSSASSSRGSNTGDASTSRGDAAADGTSNPYDGGYSTVVEPHESDRSTSDLVGTTSHDTASTDATLGPDTQLSETQVDVDAGGGGPAVRTRLVVADPEAAALYIYDIPSLELVGQVDSVHFAEHAGFLPLSNGKVLFADDQNYTLNIHDVFGEVPGDLALMVSLASPPVHFAVDPSHRFAAVSGMGDDSAGDVFTLVDLTTWDTAFAPIPTGEPGVLLGGDPLLVYHRNSEPSSLETYAFETLWSGEVTQLSSVALGNGPHGEAVVHTHNKLFSAADEGIYVVTAEGISLSEPRVIPYAASGRTGGRAFYARLGTTGDYLYSYLRDDGENHDRAWADWTNDVFIVDVANETASRVAIGEGLVYRLAESERFAIFAQYHPDGDFAHFLDTDPNSPSFHEIVAVVPLPAMSKRPTGDDPSPWTSEAFRLTGIVPSGRYAFVTQGGDGEVLVIDTETMAITGTIDTPTPLNYGGYLLGMEEGAAIADTVGR